MSVPVACPGCAAKLNAPDSAAGKRVKCPKCQTAMLVPDSTAAVAFEVVDEPQPAKKPSVRPKVKAVVETDVDQGAEDAKPRKKAKKRPREAESGVSMTRNIIMSVVLIVLVGVAGYIFYDRSRNSSEDVASNKSDDVPPINAAGGGRNPGGSRPNAPEKSGPQTLVSPAGFKITFPGPFRSNERAAGEIQKRLGLKGSAHELESDSIQVLCIQVEIPPNFSVEDRKKLSDLLFQAFIVEGSRAAVTESRKVQQGGFDWEEFVTQQANSSTIAIKRLAITTSRAFLLGVRKEPGIPPSDLVKHFFESFEIYD